MDKNLLKKYGIYEHMTNTEKFYILITLIDKLISELEYRNEYDETEWSVN